MVGAGWCRLAAAVTVGLVAFASAQDDNSEKPGRVNITVAFEAL